MTDRTLSLTRPLVSFDLETTGLDVKNDRIVELSCIKLNPNLSRETLTMRVNPGMPIPQAASRVHGITDADVARAPSFREIAVRLMAFMQDADLTGFNIERFDLPLLRNEFARLGIEFPEGEIRIVDSHRIFIRQEPRDLSAALRFYCNRELEGAHSAEADAEAAADVLLAQLERYEDLPTTVGGLHDFCHKAPANALDPDGKIIWLEGEPVLSFGKHRNRSLQHLAHQEPDYLRWISKSDFSDQVRGLASQALEGQFPNPPAARAISA
jgi:DNA polymerase-3 subunit epsilon